MAQKKLEVKNLRISFRTPDGKVQAVRNISFDLYKGETLAIVGESGSGKSVTNKAIIGISSGNAIIESGEILYDGQDLLKISEEDFHKIRGDKIAMIFQDPMSSLNPIMKVGKQLTEAMLLKGKTSQRNARKSFNSLLAQLRTYMIKADPENDKRAIKDCATLNKFCVVATKLERKHNEQKNTCFELADYLNNIDFLLSKGQPINPKVVFKRAINDLKAIYDPLYIKDKERFDCLINDIKEACSSNKAKSLTKLEDADFDLLQNIRAYLKELSECPDIDYFTLGYYLLDNKLTSAFVSLDIEEINKRTREYIDNRFMLEYIEAVTKAMTYSLYESCEKKKAVLSKFDEAAKFFDDFDFDIKKAKTIAKDLGDTVEDVINRCSIIKSSKEYSFKNSLKALINRHEFASKNNPKELDRFVKQDKKYQKLVNAGKEPDWKVVPAALIDQVASKNAIVKHILDIKAHFEKQIIKEPNFNHHDRAVEIIDFLKDKASLFVHRVTKSEAKRTALKLLTEVGIQEPERRYNQYPFEFSGGMRQRIVIAIALAANPDILICDEPTTALDVTIQSQILELINKLKVERQLSIIFITHDLGVVANMADRIAVMYAGKIVETGTSQDVFYDPRHPYTWALLSSMPDLETKEKLEAIPGTPPNMIFPPHGDAFAERNVHALKVDFEKEPPLFKISDTHYAATWLLHPKAPHIDPPKIVTERIKRMRAKRGQ